MRRVAALTVAAALASPGFTVAVERSRLQRAEFQRAHPCPSTGRTRGACPGWQVDHIQALMCGGRDETSNMQWLTVEAHREKTKADIKSCKVDRR